MLYKDITEFHFSKYLDNVKRMYSLSNKKMGGYYFNVQSNGQIAFKFFDSVCLCSIYLASCPSTADLSPESLYLVL